MPAMVSAIPFLLMAAAAQAAPAGSATPTATGPTEVVRAPATGNEPCETPLPKDGDQEIVICVERPEGYRIDPDIMDAEKGMKRKKLKRPERYVDKSCANVGPMGCRGEPGINLLAAAVFAATAAKRAANGENVGEMFITDPQPDEYELYQEAKREREARKAAEAEAAQAEVEARLNGAPEPKRED
jgi:hypothetical protein